MSEKSSQTDRISAPWFLLRLMWVVFQLMLVYALGASGASFVYQGF
jgi:hypothetical protein